MSPIYLKGKRERLSFSFISLHGRSRLCCNQAGSFLKEDGKFYIKTCLSRRLRLDQRHTLEDASRRPFQFECDYYEAENLAFSAHVKYLPSGHHCFLRRIIAHHEPRTRSNGNSSQMDISCRKIQLVFRRYSNPSLQQSPTYLWQRPSLECVTCSNALQGRNYRLTV